MRTLASESTATRQPRWPAVVVVVFAVCFVAGLVWLAAGATRKITTVEIPAGWEITDVVKALNDGGMNLHPVTQRLGDDLQNSLAIYLCETNSQDLSYLSSLYTNRTNVETQWKGIVLVTRQGNSISTLTLTEDADNWLITDHFSFYGEKRLILRIRTILAYRVMVPG